MRAFAIDSFGQQGSVMDLPEPTPNADQVVVDVAVAALNAFDAVVLAGYAKDYMEHRFPLVPGMDLAGTVTAVGADVTRFAVGDQVLGQVGNSFQGSGSLSESVAAAASDLVAKPESVDVRSAAALPMVGLTALALHEAADPQPDQVIVVLGAAGGVGSYLLQLLASRGAHVVGVTRSDNAAYVRGLGAAGSVDYNDGKLVDLIGAEHGEGIDTLIDLVGNKAVVTELAALVRPGGKVLSPAGGIDAEALEGVDVVASPVNKAPSGRLSELVTMLADGRLRTPQLREYPLDRAAEAFADLAGRHVPGKIIVIVDPEA